MWFLVELLFCTVCFLGGTSYESDLDQLIEKYQENFEKRNIGMLEFIDFLEAYLATKKITLEAVKKAQQAKEILNYTVGTEIK